LNSKINYKK